MERGNSRSLEREHQVAASLSTTESLTPPAPPVAAFSSTHELRRAPRRPLHLSAQSSQALARARARGALKRVLSASTAHHRAVSSPRWCPPRPQSPRSPRRTTWAKTPSGTSRRRSGRRRGSRTSSRVGMRGAASPCQFRASPLRRRRSFVRRAAAHAVALCAHQLGSWCSCWLQDSDIDAHGAVPEGEVGQAQRRPEEGRVRPVERERHAATQERKGRS